MKRLILTTAIVGILGFSSAYAQKKDPAMSGSKLGIGAEFAFPTGNSGDAYDFGYGGSLQFQKPIANSLNFTASAGYLNFKGKEYAYGPVTVAAKDFSAVPLKAGLRYFVAENVYLGGELGAAIGTSDGAGTAFAYAPSVGVEFPVSNKGSIDLGARYEGWSNKTNNSYLPVKNFVGLRLAYNFGL